MTADEDTSARNDRNGADLPQHAFRLEIDHAFEVSQRALARVARAALDAGPHYEREQVDGGPEVGLAAQVHRRTGREARDLLADPHVLVRAEQPDRTPLGGQL